MTDLYFLIILLRSKCPTADASSFFSLVLHRLSSCRCLLSSFFSIPLASSSSVSLSLLYVKCVCYHFFIFSQYRGLWHCFVGRNFGSFVTHEDGKFCYFYIGQTGFLLFGTV